MDRAAIFVSSTFTDMHAERASLDRVVFPELRYWGRRKGIDITAVDLRWGITREESDLHRAVKLCLAEVRRCAPFFIALLGDRYGWVPPPETIPSNRFNKLAATTDPRMQAVLERCYSEDQHSSPKVHRLRARRFFEENDDMILSSLFESSSDPALGLSITEREIREALLCPNILPCVYLRQSSNTFDVTPTVRDLFVEQGQRRRARLNALKRWVCQEPRIRVRHYIAQLPSTINGGVVLPPDWEERVIEDLCSNIDRVYETTARPGPDHRLWVSHERFLEERVQGFIGRETTLQRIAEYLASPSKHLMVIVGPSGVGKSALMAKAVEQARAVAEGYIVCRFIGSRVGENSTPGLLRSVWTQLLEAARNQRTSSEDSALPDVPERDDDVQLNFIELLRAVSCRRPIVLFFDALDQLDDSTSPGALMWLPRQVPKNTHIVVSTIPGQVLSQLRVQGGDPACTIELVPLDFAQRRQLVESRLLTQGKRLEGNQLERLVGMDGGDRGLPLYLVVATEELCHVDFERLEERIAELPPDVPTLFAQVLAGIEEEHGQVPVRAALGAIGVSRGGLTESEIRDVLHREAGSAAAARWPRVFHALAFYLRGHGERDEEAILGFFHMQLRVAVHDRYLRTPGTTKALHRNLALGFQAERDASGWLQTPVRALSELPFHMLGAETWTELETVLCDLSFVWAKIVRLGLPATRDDFLLLGEGAVSEAKAPEGTRIAARRVAEAIAISAHVVSDAPNELWAQLTARLALDRTLQLIARLIANPLPVGVHLKLCSPTVDPAAGSLIATLTGHKAGVQAVAIDPNGRLAVSASWDHSLILWALSPPRALRRLTGHSRPVMGVAVLPGNRALSGGWDETIRLWDLEWGEAVVVIPTAAGAVFCLDVAKDGSWVVAGHQNGWITCWHLPGGEALGRWQIHGRYDVRTVAVLSDGTGFLSAAGDGTVCRWTLGGECQELASGEPPAHGESRPAVVAIHPINQCFAWVPEPTVIELIGLKRTIAPSRLKGHQGLINHIGFSQDGTQLVSAADDCTVRIWDLASEHEIGRFHHVRDVNDAMFVPTRSISPQQPSADSRENAVLTASWDKTLKLWDLKTADRRARNDHSGFVHQIIVAGRWAVSAGADGELRVWDGRGGQLIQVIKSHSAPVMRLATVDRRRIVSGSWDGSAALWDVEEGRLLRQFQGLSGGVSALAVDPSAELVVVGYSSGLLSAWRFDNSDPIAIFDTGGRVTDLIWRAGSDEVVGVGWQDNRIFSWRPEHDPSPQTFGEHAAPPMCICLSSNGRYAIVGLGLTTEYFDLPTTNPALGRDLTSFNSEVERLKNDLCGITGVDLFKEEIDWNDIARVTHVPENGVVLWELKERRQILHQATDGWPVAVLADSPDGLGWLVGAGKYVYQVSPCPGSLRRIGVEHGGEIHAIAVAAWLPEIVTGSSDHVVRLIDPAADECTASFTVDSPIRTCAFEPEGGYIFVGDEHGRVHCMRKVSSAHLE